MFDAQKSKRILMKLFKHVNDVWCDWIASLSSSMISELHFKDHTFLKDYMKMLCFKCIYRYNKFRYNTCNGMFSEPF